MNIPSLTNIQFIDPKSGKLTDVARLLLTQLLTPLQQNLSNNGYLLPQQNSSTIASLNNTRSTSAIIYNNEVHSFMGNINGVFKTFTLT